MLGKATPAMSSVADLTARESHFDFGKNWAEYSEHIDERRLGAAMDSLRQLVPEISGKTLLDIGSGSGLFSAAALRLGAKHVHAMDIDEDSVATTRRVLEAHAQGGSWTVQQRSVFDLSPEHIGQFDIVYSWGVLHHTGDMWRAIERASRMVAPGGIFVFALYHKTPLCGVWRLEKRGYMRAPPAVQKAARRAYELLFRIARFAYGRGFSDVEMDRGMHFEHDVHDWMGGYPYESTSPDEVFKKMDALGFERVVELPVKVHLAGLFGTGCSEYVYRRSGDQANGDLASAPVLPAKSKASPRNRSRLHAALRERKLFAMLLMGHALIRDYRFTWDRIEWWSDAGFNAFLDRFRERNRFNTHRRWMLWQLLRLIEQVPGDTAECGVFRGAGSWLICAGTEGSGRKHHLFDSFEGLSPPQGPDGSYWAKGDLTAGEDLVRKQLKPFADSIVFHPGWIPSRFDDVAEKMFAFVHIDVDLFEPTLASIEFFYPRLSPGAVLLCDDYQSSICPGATEAIDRFLADKPEKMVVLDAGGGFFIKGLPTAAPRSAVPRF